MNKRQREYWLMRKSINRKLFCICCGKPLQWYQEPIAIVEHKDNDPTNNTDENIHIYCRGCNQLKNPRKAKKRITEKMHITSMEQTQSQAINTRVENPWRAWTIGKIDLYAPDGFPVEHAIYGGAELFKCSPATIDRYYLPKLTSINGRFYIEDTNIFRKKSKFD